MPPFLAKIFQTLILLAIFVLAPTLPKPELLMTWPIWLAFFLGFLFNVSQPHFSPKEVVKGNENERWSQIVLGISGALVFLIPVLDYVYGRQARPLLTDLWSIIGLLGVFGGLAFRIWAIRTLGKYFTDFVRVQDGQPVIDYGPYRFVRHPSYSGALIMAVSLSLVLRSYVGIAFSLIGFFGAYIYRILVEEKVLARDLGEPYVNYMKKTWRLLPPIF